MNFFPNYIYAEMLGCILHLAAVVTKIWVITDDEWWILSS